MSETKPKIIQVIIGNKLIGTVEAKKFIEMLKIMATPATEDEKKAFEEKTTKNKKGKSVGKKSS